MCRRPFVAVLLLSGLVGYQKSSVEGVNGCRRSIIAVPPFVRHQTVAVGYDGRCRRIFENMDGDDDNGAPVCGMYIAIGLVPCDKSESGEVEKLTVLLVNYFPSPIRP